MQKPSQTFERAKDKVIEKSHFVNQFQRDSLCKQK